MADYDDRVPERNEGNNWGHSEDFPVGTNRPPTMPGPLAVANVTDHCASLSWGPSSDPDGDRLIYEIEYKINEAWCGFCAWGPGGSVRENSKVLEGLVPMTGYDVRVRAVEDRAVDPFFGPSLPSECRVCEEAFTTLPEVSRRQIVFLLAGLNGRVHYNGVGLTPWGKEPAAEVRQMVAEEDLADAGLRLGEQLAALGICSCECP
jgi:hypothetical protein